MDVFSGNVKRVVLVCIALAGFQQFCHAELEQIYGYWVDSTTYDRIVANSENERIGEMNMIGLLAMFRWDPRNLKEEYYALSEGEKQIVDKVEWVSEREIRIMFAKPQRGTSPKPPDIVVQIVFDDVIKVFSGPNNDQVKLLYRILNFLKKPVQRAVINADGVRFRVKPNLESDIWLVLNEDYGVDVLGRSAEKQKIGNLEAYWYEVRYDGIFDGWVFGAYLDFQGPKNNALN
jgi:hypothetical protein